MQFDRKFEDLSQRERERRKRKRKKGQLGEFSNLKNLLDVHRLAAILDDFSWPELVCFHRHCFCLYKL